MYKRLMALDVGEKRIGIAFSDLLRLTAQGKETYNRKEQSADFEYLCKMFKENDSEKIICGLPKNMDGSLGFQAQSVMEFADSLAQYIGCDVVYEDERLTSAFAERTLIEADVSRSKRKKVIDKLAAVAILQSYLDKTPKEI